MQQPPYHDPRGAPRYPPPNTKGMSPVIIVLLDGANIEIDLLVTTKKLRVDTPPHAVSTVWKMTVEGDELTRQP